MAFTFWSFAEIEEASNQRMLSRQIRLHADSFLLAMKDAELGERGYLLTGDESYLPPYHQALERVETSLQNLRRLVRIPLARLELDAATPLIEAELQALAAVVNLRREGNAAAALKYFQQGEGRQLINDIRTRLDSFLQIQAQAHQDYEAQFSLSMRRLFGSIVAMGVLALLFTLYFAASIYRQAQHRVKQALHRETQHLLDVQENANVQLSAINTSLRLSEERLAVTLKSIGDAVIATDSQARITLLNPVAQTLTGWSQSEAKGLLISDVFRMADKQTRAPIATPVANALAFGVVQSLTNHTVLIARDGHALDIGHSCAPIRDTNNHIVGAVLVFRDVTAQYQAQQVLQDSAALVQSVFNTVVDGIVTFHAKSGAIESTNPAVEDLFGYTDAELKGKSFLLLVPEFSQMHESIELAYFGASAEALARGLPRGVIGKRKDGSHFALEVSTGEMLLRGERFFTALLRDVSTRKAAEDERRKAGALQRAIFNSEVSSSIVTDIHGVIQIFSVGAQRMLGYSAAEVINGITATDLSDPQELVERALELSLKSGSPIAPGFEALVFKACLGIEDIFELTYIHKDGRRVPVLMSVTALRDDKDTLIGFLLIGSDNSARKLIEADRVLLDQTLKSRNEELELARSQADKANQAKSDFLSSMSHELRTPLGAILGFAQLLESGTPQPTITQQRSVNQILKAGWHLLELVNEILDLALIESGKMSMSMEPVALRTVLQECEAMVELQAQRTGIRMVFNHGENPYFVWADRTRLKQVLVNLLSNAIKYNRPNGTVTVRCELADPQCMRVSVRDTGPGLSPEQLAQLFQPFNRLGQGLKGEEGTGIGLVVCRRLVELMGGQIGVTSTVEEGSVFWFLLASATAPQTPVLAASAPGKTKGILVEKKQLQTLLYVEDNPANLMLVEDLIARREDVRLLVAPDGDSGIEMARLHLPDVILMDINLPGISGIGVMRILASDTTTAQIPVIALSANAIPRDIEKGLEAGFLRYLTKPIKIDAFMEALDLGFAVADKRTQTPLITLPLTPMQDLK